ncbi:putative DD34D transposase [Trichonephila clavipes]|nr:putative DD34D transposase [Trichonephila clavipes]
MLESQYRQGAKVEHKTVLSHWRNGFKKKLHVWVRHQTPKNMVDRISICKALAKRNEIDPFLKRMVTGDEKWVTYDNVVRKRSWSKCGEAAQTVAKPGLTTRKSLVYADEPQTLDHLEDNILRVIADIRPQMLEKVNENGTSRLDYIRASRGSPMPEIIFKM